MFGPGFESLQLHKIKPQQSKYQIVGVLYFQLAHNIPASVPVLAQTLAKFISINNHAFSPHLILKSLSLTKHIPRIVLGKKPNSLNNPRLYLFFVYC